MITDNNMNIFDISNDILIKEYLIFHIKDSKEQRELLDYLDQLQQKENIIKEVREYIEKYDLRAGMGLSFVQIGILKRIFVIMQFLFVFYILIIIYILSRILS